MTDIKIAKLNITMNLIKVVSLWICSAGLVFQMGVIWQDIKTRLSTYDDTVKDVKELKEWRTKVTAYYLPDKKTK